jgi:hypothetical protein
VLGQDHSLVWLGWNPMKTMPQPLGDYWKPGYSIDTIGPEWWRAILAASILCVTFGFCNIFASMVFRVPASKTENGIKVTSRQIRTHGNLALQHATKKQLDMEQSFVSQFSSSPHRDNFSARSWPKEEQVEPSSAVRRITRVFNPRNFRKSRIQISKPIPQGADVDVERGYSSHSHGQQSHGHGTDDDRASPVVPTLQRPPTAMHPAFTGGSHYSMYSEANMPRF